MDENAQMWGSESYVKRLVKFTVEVGEIEDIKLKKIQEIFIRFISMADDLRMCNDDYRSLIEEIIENIEPYPINIRRSLAKFFLGEFQDHAKILKITTKRVSRVKSYLLKLIVDTGKSNS